MTPPPLGGPGRWAPAAAVIAALRSRAEDIRRTEVLRVEGRWEALTPGDRRRLEALTRSIVGALLDGPTARLHEPTAHRAEYVQSARYLFGLEAVAKPDSGPSRDVGEAGDHSVPRPASGGSGASVARMDAFATTVAPTRRRSRS